MAVTTSSSATIRGIYYSRGSSFTCYAAYGGSSDSEGSGSARTLTKGTTYYFYSKASGDYVTNPYAVSTSTSSSGIIGWYKENVFPYQTYTVSYNANGGSGAPSSQTKTYGVTLTLSSTKPTRTGYTFKGWSTSSSATSASYSAGGSYTSNSSATLYAVWSINTYTISYDANGGSGAPSSQTKTYGTALTLSSTKPTRTGYTFLGWSTSSTATSATYSAGGSFTTNATTTLYAVWQLATYTVSYNANGGNGAPDSQTKTYNITLSLSTTEPTRTGYTFASWNTAANGSGTSYSSGGSYTANSAVTLYAQWTANTYIISYDANGGSGAPAAQTKTHDTSITLSSTTPTREGYYFTGWGLTADAPAAAYSPGSAYTEEGDVTLYAVWSLIVVCSLYYELNGGTNGPESQKHEQYTTTQLSYAIPQKTGYDFIGWSTTNGKTRPDYLPGSKYYNDDFSSGDIVPFYAIWRRHFDLKIKKPSSGTVKAIHMRF